MSVKYPVQLQTNIDVDSELVREVITHGNELQAIRNFLSFKNMKSVQILRCLRPSMSLMLSRRVSSTSIARLSDSEFESSAVKELSEIANILESRADEIGADSVDIQEGVLSLEFPNGVFVLNKHLASHQIWYSSPVSPPAYFDPVSSPVTEKWWSQRIGQGLRAKLFVDIRTLTGRSVIE